MAAQDEVIFASEHGWFKQVIDTIVDHLQQVPAGLPILGRRFEPAQKIGDAQAALHLHLVVKPGFRPGDDGGGNVGGQYLHAQSRPTARMLARSEEHTSELQSLMRISYAVFCLKKKKRILHN